MTPFDPVVQKVTILGIAGSPRAGNTEIMVREALAGAIEVGQVETEFFSFHRRQFGPCIGECYEYRAEHGDCCFMDDFQEFLDLWLRADGIIVGVPVYHVSVPAQVKAAIDRLGKSMLAYEEEEAVLSSTPPAGFRLIPSIPLPASMIFCEGYQRSGSGTMPSTTRSMSRM